MKEKSMSFIRRRKWWIIVALIILAVVIFQISRNGENGIEKLTVMRGEVVSEVSETGQVKPARSIDLAFEGAGRINRIYVEVGERVQKGSWLVSQENAGLQAQLAQAQATLKQQQAKFDELKKGTRPEDLAAKRAELEKAKEDLAAYYQGTVNTVSDAFAKADDAVRSKADSIFINGDSITPQLIFSVSDSQAEVNAVSFRLKVREELTLWRDKIDTAQASPAPDTLEGLLYASENHLGTIRNFLTHALDAANKAAGVTTATLDTYKTNIYTARTNVNTAATSVTTQRQNIATQKLSVAKTQSEYNAKVAGSTPEQITAQEALVEQAEGQVNYHLSQIAKTILRAPFPGIITKINNNEGEIITANTQMVSLVGEGKYEIEIYIAESDIAKVKVGNTAKVTLDAYGSNVFFDAAVTKIDLSETLLESVATYKAVLQFTEEDERILPGLTANVDILSERKESVLYVPTRNVIMRDGRQYVKIVNSEKIVSEIEIKAGIRGSDGRTEIISGLEEGMELASLR